MRGGQVGPALLAPGHHVLELAVLVLGLLGARARLLVGGGQPARLLLGRGQPAPRGPDLAAQPGQPLGALGGGAGLRGEPPLGLGQRGLGLRPPGHDAGQLIPGGGQPLPQLLLLLAQRGGLGVKLVGIPAGPLRLRRSGKVPVPFAGQAEHAA